MMKRLIIHLIFALSMLFSATCFAGLNDYPTVAVVNIQNKAAIPNSLDAGDLSKVADLLTDELVCTGRFDVIERDRLKDVLDEQYLSGTGLIDNSTAVQMGKLLGAQYIVVGSINNLSTSRSHIGVGTIYAGAVDSAKNSVTCNISARIVDVATGRVVLAGRGAGKSSRAGVELGFVQERRHYSHSHYIATHMIKIGSDEVTGQMVYNALEKAVMDLVDGKRGMITRMDGKDRKR